MDNVLDHADALAMAVRLKMAGKCPADVDNLLGQVLTGIAAMATKKLLKKEPSFICFSSTMFSPDVQSELVYLELRAIASGTVNTSNPFSMIKFFEKTAQNRLRNIRRNVYVRARRAEILTESQLDVPTTDALAARVADIEGKEIHNNNTRKVRQCHE